MPSFYLRSSFVHPIVKKRTKSEGSPSLVRRNKGLTTNFQRAKCPIKNIRHNRMTIFALTFPLLFIFHDLEEIIGMRRFVNRNADMLQTRFPFLYKRLKNSTTEGFALAVMEEFVVFTSISLVAIYFDNSLCWNIWYGGFLGLTAHYVMHIGQALVIRRYIPALITSIICLPISVLILHHCYALIDINVWHIIIGLAIVALNMIPALKIAGRRQ